MSPARCFEPQTAEVLARVNACSADQNLEAVAVAVVERIRTAPASIIDVAVDQSERQIIVRVIPLTGLEAVPLESP